MKIAVNTRFLLPNKLEGVGWFTHEVVRRLVARHPEHQFYFLFDRPYDNRFIFGPNVKPFVLPPPARHPVLWCAWFEWAVPYLLKKKAPDLFFSPDGYASLRTRTPTVMVTHDIAHAHYPDQVPRLVGRFYQHYVPRYLQRARRIITVSQFVKRDLQQTYSVPPEKIRVAGNGCREGFAPLSGAEKRAVREQYADGRDYFFYLGAVHPRKNVQRLIQAFDRFKNLTSASTQLLIGGRLAWQTGATRQAYEQSRHRNAIRFLGYLEEKALNRLMGGALALAYVSCFEGFGVPLLEAMQAEVPIITGNRTALPEVAGEAAVLVDPGEIDEIAWALERVYRDESLRERLVTEGKKQRAQYSWEKVVDVVETGIFGN